ncbi:MAG: substrate-binding domain-containing protein [Candidatus Wallbacteria bacterium]|nr:substrate-binding domain-containing protein [Candidatus Wallbacteria bacterium]
MRTRMKVFSVLFLAGTLLAVAGCQPPPSRSGPLRIGGSSIMEPVTKAWLASLQKLPHPLEAQESPGGSTNAIQELLQGNLDVVTSSRRISTAEIVDARSRGVRVEEAHVGFAIYAVVVHASNPIGSITAAQIREVFTRRVKDWSALGGPKLPITCIYRRVKPGDYDHFFERTVKTGDPIVPGEVDQGTVVLTTTSEIASAVATNPAAVGYLLMTDIGSAAVKTLQVQAAAEAKPAPPTIEAAAEGLYPLLRPLYLYIDRASPRAAGYFRDYAISPEGCAQMASLGFVPLPRKAREVDREMVDKMLSW